HLGGTLPGAGDGGLSLLDRVVRAHPAIVRAPQLRLHRCVVQAPVPRSLRHAVALLSVVLRPARSPCRSLPRLAHHVLRRPWHRFATPPGPRVHRASGVRRPARSRPFTGSEVKDSETIERIRAAAQLAARALAEVGKRVEPGVTTDEL